MNRKEIKITTIVAKNKKEETWQEVSIKGIEKDQKTHKIWHKNLQHKKN